MTNSVALPDPVGLLARSVLLVAMAEMDLSVLRDLADLLENLARQDKTPTRAVLWQRLQRSAIELMI